jgi:predicted transglutaminase-like cysteine proteinase
MGLKKVVSILFLFFSLNAQAGMLLSAKGNDDINEFPKWTQMLMRMQKEEAECDNCAPANWLDLIEAEKKNTNKMAVLENVNRFINKVKYAEDIDVWFVGDYWETPYQFFKYGGDCEDYAIAKFITLQKIGFSNDDMRLLVLENKGVNTIHAVLVVTINGKDYVLDNRVSDLVEANNVDYYTPIFAINETNWWRYNG